MPALWLAQLLCPQRHCLCALAYDIEETPAADIEAKLHKIGSGELAGLNPWCGLCGSKDLRIEHGKLFTDDWDEALPVLKAQELENIRSRLMLERSNN